jgi:hypothetical protein
MCQNIKAWIKRYLVFYEAYKCYDCLNEDNSILCAECFDLDTHKGHQFERI